MPIHCPSCQKDDRIDKVSAIHSGGISHGTFYSTDGPVSGTSQTALSGKLAPLPKPSISCFVTGCSGYMVVLGVLFLLFAITSDSSLGFNLMGIIGIVLGLGIYLLASLFVKRKMRHWTAAMKVWDRCYYCNRDGLVFDPINGATIPIDSFNEYLKKTVA